MMDDFFMRFARHVLVNSSAKKKRRAVPGDEWEHPITKISNLPGPHVPAHTEISCSLTILVSVSDYADLSRSPVFWGRVKSKRMSLKGQIRSQYSKLGSI